MTTLVPLILILGIFGGFLPLSTAKIIPMSTCIFISVKSKIEKMADPALENSFFVQESMANESLLIMIQIRTTSSKGLKQLRAMNLDIVKVRPDPHRVRDEDLFSGEYVIEAVVTKGELAKLKKMGFEVSEIPKRIE